jgi:exonuclease III
MDMRFGTWNVRSLYRSGSLKTVTRELGKYKLEDLVGVQEVRWARAALNGQRIIHFSMERGMKIIS